MEWSKPLPEDEEISQVKSPPPPAPVDEVQSPPASESEEEDKSYRAALQEGLANMKAHGQTDKDKRREQKKKDLAKKRLAERQKTLDLFGANLRYHPKGTEYRRT